MKNKMIIAAMALALPAAAQTDTTVLQGVTVQGYAQQRDLSTVPGAVSVVRGQDMQRVAPGSLVPAFNAAPGVRMEERSPGSYRLNIRGSSLRSPFGVRNVKMYYNGLPFTDPGGNTYLNQFSPVIFSSLEVLKGPGSSLYGAGTGACCWETAGLRLTTALKPVIREAATAVTRLRPTHLSAVPLSGSRRWYRGKSPAATGIIPI